MIGMVNSEHLPKATMSAAQAWRHSSNRDAQVCYIITSAFDVNFHEGSFHIRRKSTIFLVLDNGGRVIEHTLCDSTLSTLRAIGLTFLFWSSGRICWKAESSVVHTGVKSAG